MKEVARQPSVAPPDDQDAGRPHCGPRRTAVEEREFLDELDAQNTDAVRERAYRYARKRVGLLARCGLPIEQSLAKHLLADAIGDTYLGDLQWDPARCTLYMHLRSVLRYRTKDMLARAQRHPHERLGAKCDDEVGDCVESEASARLPRDSPEERTATVQLATQVARQLYAAAEAKNDNAVTQVLDAYRDGVTRRAEIVKYKGLTRRQYDHARERINRMLKRLPEQLAADARRTLGVKR